jgi:Phage tail tube protein
MALLSKIDSNVTGLRYAEEASIKVLPGTPEWRPLEPNSYTDFGGQITTIARNPINPSRQRKKGVTTDLDANGGFDTDITQTNLQDILQGFFFANLRPKPETIKRTSGAGVVTYEHVPTTSVDGAAETYVLSNIQANSAVVAAGGTGYTVGDVLTATGGTSTTTSQFTVLTVAAGVVLTVSVTRRGRYTVYPGNPVSTTGGTGTGCTLTVTSGPAATFLVGHLIFASGYTNAANNGLKRITAVTVNGTTLTVAENLVTETPSATAAELVAVGAQAGAGDLDIDNAGSLPALTSTTLNFTTLGLIVGEWLYLGGDVAANQFDTAANNGFKRIRTIAANRIEFDKSVLAMVTEANAADTIQIFWGRVLKNELGTLIRRRTYNLERTLGAPEDSAPTSEQAEYLEGQIFNEFNINVPVASKATATLNFIGTDNTTRAYTAGLKSGTRPALIEADAFNTSSDVSRIKMAQVVAGNPAPTALFAFLTELTFTGTNNATPNKAVGVLGAFEVTAGTFEIGGTVTAYFASVDAIAAVRANADVTIDAHLVKANAGITIDLPLISLGNGRLSVEQDQPITLPLDISAATAAKIDANLDYTLLLVFWDYLPSAADV